MKNEQKRLSSDEALEDYFRALLDIGGEEECTTDIELSAEDSELELEVHSIAPIEDPVTTIQQEIRIETKPKLSTFAEQEVCDEKSVQTEKLERLFDQAHQDNRAEVATSIKPVTPEVEIIAEEPSVKVSQENIEEQVEALAQNEIKTELEAQLDLQTEVDVPTPVFETRLVDETTDKIDETEVITLESESSIEVASADLWDNHSYRDSEFPVLYFNVNRVTFAVPLAELGGIHQIQELTHMIGRSSWYLGLQSGRTKNIDVIDTAMLVMPDKLVDDTHTKEYQYIVVLGESKWGLAGDQLLGTEVLSADMVRWRESAGKRPWLAGMVKEKMCALIHVKAMVRMLSQGLNINGNN